MEPNEDGLFEAYGVEWPWWVPLGTAAAALAVTLAALGQRHALFPPKPSALLGLLALSPWILEHTLRPPPRLVFAAVVLAATLALIRNPTEFDFAPFLLVLLAGEMGATTTLRTGVVIVVAASAAMIAVDLSDVFSGGPLWVAGILAAYALGVALRSQLIAVQQERASHAALAATATVEERQRLAREVHDVVAHSLSVTMLHVTAARHALETAADVDEAVESLREAERIGREATADIRRTVGLLDPAGGATQPLPGLGELPELIAGFERAGLHVHLSQRGATTAISPAIALGLYRVTQESLANIARHAPGAAAEVCLDLDAEPMRLEVRNPVAGNGPSQDGRGIRGMRERVELLGGSLRAGRAGAAWVVDARIPRPHP
jgi:signal transduction histidine kinase